MQPPKKPSALKIILTVLLVYGISAALILLLSSLIGFWLNGSEGASFALGIGVMINILVFPTVGYVLVARLKSLSDPPKTTIPGDTNGQKDEARSN
ncbi:MAG: hypothetical protein AB2L16_07570 [Anaerolineaceae bacterium]|jgi:uncharacterized membrane protein